MNNKKQQENYHLEVKDRWNILSIIQFILSIGVAYAMVQYLVFSRVELEIIIFFPVYIFFVVVNIILIIFILANSKKRRGIVFSVLVIPIILYPFISSYTHDIYLQKFKPLTFCGWSLNQNKKSFCISQLANVRRDIKICNRLDKIIDKERCYSDVAEKKNDINICNDIKDEVIRDDCFYNIAENLNNIQICDYIKFNGQGFHRSREGCYYVIAFQHQDTHLCDLIVENIEMRAGCYKAINFNLDLR